MPRAPMHPFHSQALGLVLVFDINNPVSFETLEKEFVAMGVKSSSIILVGTQVDRGEPDQAVTRDLIERSEWAAGMKLWEVSARDGFGVEELKDALLNLAKQTPPPERKRAESTEYAEPVPAGKNETVSQDPNKLKRGKDGKCACTIS